MIDLNKPRLTEKGNKYELLFGNEPLYARLQELENAIESGELAEVVRGRWLRPFIDQSGVMCSVCESKYFIFGATRYCPNCGAKMDVEP